MKSRSKLALSAAALVIAGGVALASQSLAADPATTPAAAPAPTAAPAPAAPTKVSDMDKKALIGAPVKDNKGEAVGEVKSVKLGPDGKIVALDVGVGDKVVSLPADSVSVADNTVISKQSKSEIMAQ